jgi:hypothetical protein
METRLQAATCLQQNTANPQEAQAETCPVPAAGSLAIYSDTPLIKSGEHNLKNIVIAVLSEQWPLSARRLYKEICAGHFRKVTYQGVFKALRQLREQGIVKRSAEGHQLDLEWIEELDAYSEFLHTNYALGKNTDFYGLLNGESCAVEYDSYFHAVQAVLEMMNREHSRRGGSDEVVIELAHPLPIIGIPSRVLDVLSEHSKTNGFAAKYLGVSKADFAMAKLWEKVGIKAARPNGGNRTSGQFNVLTKGLLIRFLLSPSFVRKARGLFGSRAEAAETLLEYSALCKDRAHKVTVVVTRNEELAREMRDEQAKKT